MGRIDHFRSVLETVRMNENDLSTLYNDTMDDEEGIDDNLNVTVLSNSSMVRGDSNTNNNSRSGIQQAATILSAFVGFILIVAMCVCMKPTHTAEAERRIRRYKRRGYQKKPPNYYRLKRIDKSLTVRQVVAVDISGQVQLGDVRKTDDVQISEHDDEDDVSNTSGAAQHEDMNISSSSIVSESNTNYENLVACCCICLEPYEVGDIVAWSSSSTDDCLHVFHHDCIHLWLINPKHKDCPSCRTIILQKNYLDDGSINSNGEINNYDDDDDDVERQRHRDSNNNDDARSNSLNNNTTSSVAYYIMHGLISRASQVKFTLIGQTISFDSEEDDSDGLYQTNSDGIRRVTANQSVHRLEWMNNPSPFRRAMSFSDRVFSNTFASNSKRQHEGSEWKPVVNTKGRNDNDTVVMRRASTKVIIELKSLQQAPALRRVVSAGPCTPLDIQKSGLREHELLSSIIDPMESMHSEYDLSPERLFLPFRRSSSMRQRAFTQEMLSDCEEDDEQIIILGGTSNASVSNVDNNDSTDEEDTIIQKEL